MNFQISEKLILWISGNKSRFLSREKVGRKMIFPYYLRKFYILRNENDDISVFLKNNKTIFLISMEYRFTGYHKVLGLNFVEMENMVFFESKSWWKYDIYWLPKRCCFQLFGNAKYRFLSQKVKEKIKFSWYFSAFDDIPWLGKYDFSCRYLHAIGRSYNSNRVWS